MIYNDELQMTIAEGLLGKMYSEIERVHNPEVLYSTVSTVEGNIKFQLLYEPNASDTLWITEINSGLTEKINFTITELTEDKKRLCYYIDIILKKIDKVQSRYNVTCTCVFNRDIEVNARNEEEAIAKVKELYFNGQKYNLDNWGFGEATVDYAEIIK